MTRTGTDIAGRTALLTGASGGIGQRIAAALGSAGANVVLTGRRKDALDEAASLVEAHGSKAAVITADLSDLDAIDDLVAAAEAPFGPISLLINNAGVEDTAPFTSLTREEITALIDLNVTSPMLLTHAILPGMLERGAGHVVFIASGAGHFPPAYAAHYAASKAALIALTRALRAEYADSPIGISVVSPGFVAGDGMYQRFLDQGAKKPLLIGTTTTDKVARAVVRAIETDAVEILITGSPARPLDALAPLAPKLHERLMARLGMHEPFREAARIRGRLD